MRRIGICFLLIVSCLAEGGFGQDQLSRPVLERIKEATVFVKVEAGRLQMTGSGFLFKMDGPTGFVATNHHVVTPPPSIKTPARVSLVFGSGTKKERVVPAEVIASDESRDLAVLKIEKLPDAPKPFDLDSKLEVLETMKVFMIGFPFGERLSASKGNPAVTIGTGTVSSLRRDDYDNLSVIQLDGDINPGNSGGPVVDNEGRLIGVAVAKLTNTGISFAIPGGELTKMLNGRVAGVEFRTGKTPPSKTEPTDINVEVRLIDPMNKINSVSLSYLLVEKFPAKIQPDKEGKYMPISDAMRVELKQQKQTASGTLPITFGENDKQKVLFQISFVDGTGKTVFTQPVFHIASAKEAPEAKSVAKTPNGATNPNRPTTPLPTTDDVQVTELKLATSPQAPACLCSSADGKSFFHLDVAAGVVRKLSWQTGEEEQSADLGHKCSWLSVSKLGLLVCVPGPQEVWVLDCETLKSSKKAPAPAATRVVSSPALEIAFACGGRDRLSVVDLNKGDVVKEYRAKSFRVSTDFRFPAVTPDGKFLFLFGGIEQIQRLAINGIELEYEESTPRIGQGRMEGIDVSYDSEFVCLASGGGNYSRPPPENHPDAPPYSTYIYSVNDLSRPVLTLEQGAYPLAVGFDPKSGLLFSQNHQKQLLIFNSGGLRKKELSLSNTAGGTRQILVQPAGRRLVVLLDNKVMHVVIGQ